jgi:dephospho-CoA kinase
MWKMSSREPMTSADRRKPVIGIIGAPGSGKSSVAAEFAKHGGRIIAGDVLGHEALMQSEIRQQVIEHFGKEIIAVDGSINRKKLGAKVFADVTERRALETLVHPYIERRIAEEIDQANKAVNVAFIVLDAAIMLETGWNNVCDKLVYIDVPRATRLDRLVQQRGWSEKEVAARESAQMSLTDKLSKADFVVDNSGTGEQTAQQVRNLLQELGLNQTREHRI